MDTVQSMNLRRADREAAAISITLVLRSEGRHSKIDATTVDLSLEGARIRTDFELVPGEWVGIMPNGEFPFAIPSRVVWVRPADAAGLFFLAGLQFLDTGLAQKAA
jgi:hypothetical protein